MGCGAGKLPGEQLLKALRDKDTEQVNKLLADGTDPNFAKPLKLGQVDLFCPTNETCLYVACSMGPLEHVTALLEAKADPNLRNPGPMGDEGKVSLHAACTYGPKEHVSALLEAKANPNLRDDFGVSPVFELTQWSRFPDTQAIFKLLIDAKADMQSRVMGLSPLMHAVNNENWPLMKALISNQQCDESEKSPATEALNQKREETKKHGRWNDDVEKQYDEMASLLKAGEVAEVAEAS